MFTTRRLPTLFVLALTLAVAACAETQMSTSAGMRERPLSSCDDLPNADQRAFCIQMETDPFWNLPDTE